MKELHGKAKKGFEDWYYNFRSGITKVFYENYITFFFSKGIYINIVKDYRDGELLYMVRIESKYLSSSVFGYTKRKKAVEMAIYKASEIYNKNCK